MKNKICLLALCLLVQSCFSYRKIEITKNEIKPGHRYKLYTTTGAKEKLIVSKVNDSIIGSSGKKKNIAIPIVDIEVIKERKLSITKTIGLPVLIAGSLVGLLFISFSPNIDLGTPDYN